MSLPPFTRPFSGQLATPADRSATPLGPFRPFPPMGHVDLPTSPKVTPPSPFRADLRRAIESAQRAAPATPVREPLTPYIVIERWPGEGGDRTADEPTGDKFPGYNLNLSTTVDPLKPGMTVTFTLPILNRGTVPVTIGVIELYYGMLIKPKKFFALGHFRCPALSHVTARVTAVVPQDFGTFRMQVLAIAYDLLADPGPATPDENDRHVGCYTQFG